MKRRKSEGPPKILRDDGKTERTRFSEKLLDRTRAPKKLELQQNEYDQSVIINKQQII